MLSLLSMVFVASLLGSLHCAGMCGPFVAFYAGTQGEAQRATWAHLAYNGGRLVTYVALGGAAGAVGAALNLAGETANIARVAALLAGGLMVLWGAFSVAIALGVRLPAWSKWSGLERLLGAASRQVLRRPPIVRALALGLLTTFLPCGWLYAFVLAAASTASPLAGVLLMFFFWLGTVPVMLGMGFGIEQLSRLLGRHVRTATAMIVLVLGVLTLVGRSDKIGKLGHGLVPSSPRAAVERAGHLHAKPTCCQHGKVGSPRGVAPATKAADAKPTQPRN